VFSKVLQQRLVRMLKRRVLEGGAVSWWRGRFLVLPGDLRCSTLESEMTVIPEGAANQI
jgi:hypothetical protein